MQREPRPRQRAVQGRTLLARSRIIEGAFEVLAAAGVEGLTHRDVASAAGVSLAATTYHFDTKSHIIEEASRNLLDDYLAAFRRMAERLAAGDAPGPASIDDLVWRVVTNALGRDRTRSLAWCELILHGGRSTAGRALAQGWYQQLDLVWRDLARLIEQGAAARSATQAIDLTVGLTFVLHPLGLRPTSERDVLAGLAAASRPEPFGAPEARPEAVASTRYTETRRQLVDAAISLVIEGGAGRVTNRHVAEAAGMVRSGPSYYFPVIDELIAQVQATLFERARQRYREGLGAGPPGPLDEARLLDLTTTIFCREALEFGSENIGHYSLWIRAAQNLPLQQAVVASVLSFHQAWSRRLAGLGRAETVEVTALRMQALFIGKLIRAIATSAPVADLSWAREDFAAILRGPRG